MCALTDISNSRQQPNAEIKSGNLFCWGNDDHGQCEIDPSFELDIILVEAGDWHTCAINKLRKMGCWGLNSNGQTEIPDK